MFKSELLKKILFIAAVCVAVMLLVFNFEPLRKFVTKA
jgi:hypothetical protein